MKKKYIVQLTDEDRQSCDGTIDKPKGNSQKVRRARILRPVDADGPNWTDSQIAEEWTPDCRHRDAARRDCSVAGRREHSSARC